MHTKQFQDCYWEFENNKLVAGNEKIERVWDLSLGIPEPLSVYNKQQEDEWLEETDNQLMKNQTLFTYIKNPNIEVHGSMDDDHGIAEQALKITVIIVAKSIASKFVLRVYPNKPLIRNEFWFKRKDMDPEFQAANASNVTCPDLQLDENSTTEGSSLADCIECLPLKGIHTRWKSVAFRDVTDTNNNLVNNVNGLLYKNENRLIRGNILFLEKSLKDSGLIVIKEGPTSLAHLHDPGGDFQFLGKNLFVVGSGIQENELERSGYMKAYGSTIGVYQGGEQKGIEVISQYHQAVRNYQPERDFFIMSNTWGDRSKDGKIKESFILSELPLAADLGVTHYQIDDGWQQGVTVNSIKKDGKWSGYHDEPGFWDVNKQRFPHGLEPIVQAAKKYNISIGLWFSPDSSNDFQHWQKDADTIIHLNEFHNSQPLCGKGLKT